MKKPVIVVLVVAALAAVVLLSLRGKSESGVAVRDETVSRRTISSRVKATGEITPEKKVEISAKIVGEIVDLPVHEGQKVRQGQLLLQIERDLYEAARDRSRAALRQAEVAGTRLEVQRVDAERTLKRRRELIDQGLASQEQLDAAQLAYDTLLVQADEQRHSVDQYGFALKSAEDDLARTTIRAPMDGTLIDVNVEKGETVVPGTMNLPGSVLMAVGDMSRLLAEVDVNEVDVVHVELDQPAEITVDALGDHPLSGHVVEIATSGEKDLAQDVIRFPVKVAVDQPNPSLRPAMTAKVDILTATHENVPAVPIQAVVKRVLDENGKEIKGDAAKGMDEQDVVYLPVDGKAEVRPVTTGISDELWVEITSGLDEGDTVITGPYRTLKALHDGDALHTEAEPTPSPATDTASSGDE